MNQDGFDAALKKVLDKDPNPYLWYRAEISYEDAVKLPPKQWLKSMADQWNNDYNTTGIMRNIDASFVGPNERHGTRIYIETNDIEFVNWISRNSNYLFSLTFERGR